MQLKCKQNTIKTNKNKINIQSQHKKSKLSNTAT